MSSGPVSASACSILMVGAPVESLYASGRSRADANDADKNRYPVARIRSSMPAISCDNVSDQPVPLTNDDHSMPLFDKYRRTISRTELFTASTSTELGFPP